MLCWPGGVVYVLVVVVVLLLILYQLMDMLRRRNFPPGPPRFSILGNLPQLVTTDKHIAEVTVFISPPFFVAQELVLEAPFLRSWYFNYCTASPSTLEVSPIQALTVAQVVYSNFSDLARTGVSNLVLP